MKSGINHGGILIMSDQELIAVIHETVQEASHSPANLKLPDPE